MGSIQNSIKLSALTLGILGISGYAQAQQTTPANAENTEQASVQTLQTLKFEAQPAVAKDPDISAIPKTIISREEMLQYGDQSVNDALRRAAGIQMGAPGQGPRGGAGAMRFRGGGAPVFLVNGEPIQGGPRGGASIIDSITPDMIERIEIVKQPSVAQASVASSAVINIILKEPLENKLISGTVRAGYGLTNSDAKEEERKNLTLQMDGRNKAWIYSMSANQMWTDSTTVTETEKNGAINSRTRITDRKSLMLTPRVEYEIDDQQKLVAEIFYRDSTNKGQSDGQFQHDTNDSLRLNTRYERKDKGNTDKVRFTVEKQNETQKTTGTRADYIDETINELGLAYDGVRKFDDKKQLKFGVDSRINELKSNVADTLDEQKYALYLEGSWRFTDRQTITVGARQEWLDRSGLVDYTASNLSPVLAHRFDFDDSWSLQTNFSRSFRTPRADDLMPTITISSDSDSGSLNNPDRGGNPNLKPEAITALETTLGYNTAAGGVNLTAYHRKIDDYIEKVIREENNRYIESPQNQENAKTYGFELTGRYALKQTDKGHSFMLNGQVSTVHASIEESGGKERLASGVAPYTASTGISYNYQPWRLATSINVNYIPEYTRTLDGQYLNGGHYTKTTNERINVDFSVTKRFDYDLAATFSARNLFSTDYKESIRSAQNPSENTTRVSETIPSFLLSIEKKF